MYSFRQFCASCCCSQKVNWNLFPISLPKISQEKKSIGAICPNRVHNETETAPRSSRWCVTKKRFRTGWLYQKDHPCHLAILVNCSVLLPLFPHRFPPPPWPTRQRRGPCSGIRELWGTQKRKMPREGYGWITLDDFKKRELRQPWSKPIKPDLHIDTFMYSTSHKNHPGSKGKVIVMLILIFSSLHLNAHLYIPPEISRDK